VTLLQPWWLTLLALSVLIVMLHARRRRTMLIPSISVWKLVSTAESTHDRHRFPPLTWPLLLQLLAFALLVLALSDPLWHHMETSDHVIFIIGGTSSSGASAAIIGTTRAIMDTLPPDTSVSVVDARGRPQPLLALVSARDASAALTALIMPSVVVPDWAEAARLTVGLVHAGDRTRIVLLASELEAAAAVATMVAELPGVEVEVAPLPAVAAHPRLVGAVLSSPDNGMPVQAVVQIESHFLTEWHGTLEAVAAGAMVTGVPVVLTEPSVIRVSLELDTLPQGRLELRLVDQENRTVARTSRIVTHSPRTLRVLIIGPPAYRCFVPRHCPTMLPCTIWWWLTRWRCHGTQGPTRCGLRPHHLAWLSVPGWLLRSALFGTNNTHCFL
jgi:hypothetical protein